MTIRRIRPEEYAEADNITRVAFLRTVREEQKNDADVPLEFFCIVPTRGDPHAKKFSMREERAQRKACEGKA